MDEAGKKKADLELEESAGKMRRLTGFWGSAAAALAAGTTLYHILDLTVFLLDPHLPPVSCGKERAQERPGN